MQYLLFFGNNVNMFFFLLYMRYDGEIINMTTDKRKSTEVHWFSCRGLYRYIINMRIKRITFLVLTLVTEYNFISNY